MSSEHALWSKLQKLLAKSGAHYTRIENLVGAGFPDVEFCLRGLQAFIELKHIKKLRKDKIVKVKVRRDQILWLSERWKRSQNAWILLSIGTQRYFLLPGTCAPLLDEGLHWEAFVSWAKLSETKLTENVLYAAIKG